MKKIVLLLIVNLCFSTFASAQIVRSLRRAAENAIINKAEKEIVNAIENSGNENGATEETWTCSECNYSENTAKFCGECGKERSTEAKEVKQKKSKSGNKTVGDALANKFMSDFSNVEYEKFYQFHSKLAIYIENTSYIDGEENVTEGYFNTYFDNSSENYAMEVVSADASSSQEDGFFIFDKNNHCMLILSNEDGEKSGMAIQMPADSLTNSAEYADLTDEELEGMNIYYKATGKTKKILGYKCREYMYRGAETDSIDVRVWATRDIDLDYSNAYKYMGMGMATYSTGTYMLGTVLEINMTDLRDNSRSDMYIKEFDAKTNKTFDLSGYQIMGFGLKE